MMTCVSTLACAALLVALILAAHRLIDAIACAVSRRRLRAKVAAWTPPGVSWIARQQRVVVIVNPNAGAGWGDCVYEDVVRPMLRRAGIEHEVVRTTCAGMAEREAAELASRKVPVDCLLSVSGDGQLHECLNGLRGGGTGGRTALAVVPAGTGNGMSDTCFGRGSDAFEALCSILCASGPTPVDVMRLTYPDEPARTPRHDLHFFCWAAFADHDYVTENGWRWLGPLLKVALAPLYVIAQRRGYAGTVEFEPAGALEPPDPEWKREAYPYSDAAALPPSPHDASLRVLEGPFWCLAVGNCPEGGSATLPVPRARMADGGRADLLVCRHTPRLTRWRCLQLFLMMEKGEHVAQPDVAVYKTRRLRLYPRGGAGHLQLSGQEMPMPRGGVVQLDVLPDDQLLVF